MRWPPPAGEKTLHWVGTAKRDLLTFPAAVVDDLGYALGVVQRAAQRDYEERYGKA